MLTASLLPVNGLKAIAQTEPSANASLPASLDSFIRDYMRTMHAPGMVVSAVDSAHVQTAAYGYSDVEGKKLVELDQPFWIGSICKSFVGLVAMQLREEGKLDLHKPVLEIMPDLPIRNSFGPITPYHLLTHTSGLPDWLQVFPSDPAQRATQAYAPGIRFAYCNLGFDVLGFIIEHLDGRTWPLAVAERIFKPLDMSGAAGSIDYGVAARMPIGYQFLYLDRPSSVVDPMVPVGNVLISDAAGSITATASDMAKYMLMLSKGGVGPKGRIVSEESFKLYSTPYIKTAPDFSPTASYGFGIAVDTLDGHKILRHTGGVTGFASSIMVDLEAGTGAFSSINAMQGYRPDPVTQLTLRFLNARKASQPAPSIPAIEDPLHIKDAAQFAGRYTAPDGEVLTVTASGNRLQLASRHGSTSLRPIGTDTFSAANGRVLNPDGDENAPSEFAMVFGRAKGGKNGNAASPVTELSVGPRWYMGEHYDGPRSFPPLADAARFTGIYSNDSPWYGPFHIVERNGKLWIDGTTEIRSAGDNRFTGIGHGPEAAVSLQFLFFLSGRAQVIQLDGEAFRRVEIGPGSTPR